MLCIMYTVRCVALGQALEVQAWGQHQKVASVADLNNLQV